MSWLFLGVLYSIVYAIVGWLLRDQPSLLSWFRAGALLVPPLVGATVIVIRRQTWRGCQWLFWSTIALGLTMFVPQTAVTSAAAMAITILKGSARAGTIPPTGMGGAIV